MLKYTSNAINALRIFFAYRNEVDIYTEDTIEDKEFYKEILRRLLEKSRLKVVDVTPLGSRSAVLAMHAKSHEKSPRKTFFIIDGDIDVLLERNNSFSKNLFIFDRYCIENFLFDETAASRVLHLLLYSEDFEAVSAKLAFQTYYRDLIIPIVDLYFAYAISQKFDLSHEFSSVSQFMHATNEIKVSSLVSEANQITADVIDKLNAKNKNGQSIVDSCLTALKKRWPYTMDTLARVVSGKDCLLHLLRRNIKKACGDKSVQLLDRRPLKLFLAQHIDMKCLDTLRQALEGL